MVPGLFLSLPGTEFKLSSPQTFNDVLSVAMRHTPEHMCPNKRKTPFETIKG